MDEACFSWQVAPCGSEDGVHQQVHRRNMLRRIRMEEHGKLGHVVIAVHYVCQVSRAIICSDLIINEADLDCVEPTRPGSDQFLFLLLFVREDVSAFVIDPERHRVPDGF